MLRRFCCLLGLHRDRLKPVGPNYAPGWVWVCEDCGRARD